MEWGFQPPLNPPISAALQCEGGQEYSPCGPPCPPTCRDLGRDPPELCGALGCLEGCFCPPGRVLHGEGGARPLGGCEGGWGTEEVWGAGGRGLGGAGRDGGGAGGSRCHPRVPPPAEGLCLEPPACPCFWDGFAFPAGATVSQGCSNW